MEPIKTRYAKKMVDGKNYGVVNVTGNADEPKRLTREEFKNGESGLLFLDKKGRIVFDD